VKSRWWTPHYGSQ